MGTKIENSGKNNRTKVAIFYHHKDTRHLNRCLVHLAPYTLNKHLDIWVDTMITPGGRWCEEFIEAVASAKVAVLLVSADFLASQFLVENQLLPLLTAAKEDGAIILTVLLSPCGFEQTELTRFKFVNKSSSEPVTKLTYNEKEELWSELAKLSRMQFPSEMTK